MVDLKNTRILFIGHFSENSSWGQAADDYIRCLETQTKHIKTKDFALTNSRKFSDSYGYKYADNNQDKYDILIQMCLPRYIGRHHGIKRNVAIFFSECEHSNEFVAVDNIRMMDYIFTASNMETELWKSKGIDSLCVGLPMDSSKTKRHYPDMSHITKKNSFTYSFYTVAEDTERKNLDQLIRVYLNTFSARDNVKLVLKVNEKSNIENRIQVIKESLRSKEISNYPDIELIKGYISQEELYGIHRCSDCYVCTSHGEAWCYPMADAVIFHNQIISPYLRLPYLLETGEIVSTEHDYCNVQNPPLHDYYTSKDKWFNIKDYNLSLVMKRVFKGKKRGKFPKNLLSNQSYETIGQRIISTSLFG